MRRFFAVRLPAALIPLAILALIAPAAAAFAFVGAQAGLAVGALTAGAVVIAAALLRYDEPIEVASQAADERYRLLVVAMRPLESPAEAQRLSELAGEGSRVLGRDEPPELLVLAPLIQSRLERWASDVGDSRLDAQDRLAVSLATLAAAGLDARGRVGDEQVVQAVEDALAEFAAQEVAFLCGPQRGGAADEVRRRLDRPVRVLSAGSGD